MALQDCTKAFDDIISKDILNDYNKLSNVKSKAYGILGLIDDKTQEVGSLPSNSFDGLTDAAAATSAVQGAKDLINTATSITGCVDSLDGDCLGGAIGGISGLIKDTTSFVSDSLDAVRDALSLPSELLDLTRLLSQLRNAFGDGGIDRLISSILQKLGCIGEKNAQIQSIENDIGVIISDFGLNADGTYNDGTFNTILEEKLNSIGNIPTEVKTNIIDNTKKINDMTKDVQENATSNLQSVKTNTKQSSATKIKKTYI